MDVRASPALPGWEPTLSWEDQALVLQSKQVPDPQASPGREAARPPALRTVQK